MNVAISPDSANRSAKEALVAYDAGDPIWTVEMGGLGPGYEQCIQVGAMELIRKMADAELPNPSDEAAWQRWGDKELGEVDNEHKLGLSGAQAGAIKNLAFRAIRDGWDAMVRSAPKDRRIQFSKSWPR